MLKKNIYFSVILDHFTPWTLQNFLSNGSQLVVDENMPGCTPELKHWLFYSILNRDFKVSGCTPNLGVKSECDTKTKNQSRHKTRKKCTRMFILLNHCLTHSPERKILLFVRRQVVDIVKQA